MNRDDAARHPVEALSALLDGEIEGAERHALETHLQECAGCRVLLEDLKAIDRAVADDEVPAAPADFARRIAASLPARSVEPAPPAASPGRAWFRAPMPLAAAASLLVAAVVWLAWPGGRPARQAALDTVATSAPPSAGSTTADEAAAPLSAPEAAPAPEAAAQSEAAKRLKETPAPVAPTPAPIAQLEKDGRAPANRAARPAMQSASPENPGVSSRADQDAGEPGGESVARAREGAERNRQEELHRQQTESLRAGQVEAQVAPPPAPAGAPAAALASPTETKVASEFIDAQPILGRNYQDVLTLAPGTSDAEGRPILPALRAEPYAVRLLPGDAMRVESGAYACTVQLSPEDARLLLAQYVAARPNAPAPVAGVDKAASAAPSAPTRQAAAGEARGIAGGPAVAEAKVITIEATPEGRALILRMVRERYRAALAERCGPLPR